MPFGSVSLTRQPTAEVRQAIHDELNQFLRRGIQPQICSFTDLSEILNRYEMERCHVLSRPSRFLGAVLVERVPVLPKPAENGNHRD